MPSPASSYLLENYARFDLSLVRGQGTRVWDDSGREYLDFGSGIAVCSLGHTHPAITSALTQQAGVLLHCSNLYRSPAQETYARELSENVVGHPGKSVFVNSGAEANETLIKLARRFGTLAPASDGSPRFGILTFERSFHGRTFAGISATGQSKIHDGFGPLLPGFTHLPYNDIEALEAAIDANTVAILLEPIQGEGGINVATPDFLATAAHLARTNNLLLLIDEVQCGFGRLGHLAGWRAILDHAAAADFIPHGVAWAKGMGGGYPIGAAWISDQPVSTAAGSLPVSGILGPGSHGTTYGGGPVACAVAQAVLDTIIRENLASHAAAMGVKLIHDICSLDAPGIREIRGLGLMLGLVLDENVFKPVCAQQETAALHLVKALIEEGLLTVPAGPNVVRLLPPLNVSSAEIDEAVSIFARTLNRIFA
jgi:acetylornithine/succinyldiaminopimelate/putrescine aminotransferase